MQTYHDMSDWENVFKGDPALVIGRGESRNNVDAQVFQARGGKVFVVNEMIKLPEYANADCMCMQDSKAMRRLVDSGDLAKFKGVIWGREVLTRLKQCDLTHVDKLSWIKPEFAGNVFNPELKRIYLTKGTPHYAFQMAFLAGCDPIYMAGVDLRSAKGRRLHADTLQDDMDINETHYFMALCNQHAFWNKVVQWQRERKWQTRGIYKTSDYSMLPFEIRGIGE